MSRKRVLITLPPDAYRRLVDLADEEERVVDQQASLLLKRLLIGSGSEPARNDHIETDGRLANACAADVNVSVGRLQPDSRDRD